MGIIFILGRAALPVRINQRSNFKTDSK